MEKTTKPELAADPQANYMRGVTDCCAIITDSLTELCEAKGIDPTEFQLPVSDFILMIRCLKVKAL
jgi:hypothetical protein